MSTYQYEQTFPEKIVRFQPNWMTPQVVAPKEKQLMPMTSLPHFFGRIQVFPTFYAGKRKNPS